MSNWLHTTSHKFVMAAARLLPTGGDTTTVQDECTQTPFFKSMVAMQMGLLLKRATVASQKRGLDIVGACAGPP